MKSTMENNKTPRTTAAAAEQSLRSDMQASYRRRTASLNIVHFGLLLLVLGVIIGALSSTLSVPPSFSQSTDVQQGNAMLRIKQIVDIA